MRLLIFCFIFLVVFVSCSGKKKVVDRSEASNNLCSDILLLSVPPDSLRVDFYEIDSMKIINDCIDIYINYGGGCGDAEFQLYFTNRIKESMPPKTILYLSFEDNDPCRSIVQKKLRFSLEPFKRFADRGGIYFKIDGKEQSILYQIPK